VRAIRILREVDWIAAEDTRRTGVLCRAYGIDRPLLPHHAHNEHRETGRLVAKLQAGEVGALVTDAGMPGLADPGFLLARAARRAEISVTVLPGASVVTTALLASGFPPEPFQFRGFVPPTSARRAAYLAEVAAVEMTVVIFETPHRIHATLTAAILALGDRPIAYCREMTKLHEEVRVGTAAMLLADLPTKVLGELALVLGPRARRGGWEQ